MLNVKHNVRTRKNVCSISKPVRALTFHNPDIFLHFNYTKDIRLQSIDVYCKSCAKIATISTDEYKSMLSIAFTKEKIAKIEKISEKDPETLNRQNVIMVVALKLYQQYLRQIKK